jgi:hypothetical protein
MHGQRFDRTQHLCTHDVMAPDSDVLFVMLFIPDSIFAFSCGGTTIVLLGGGKWCMWLHTQ